MNFIHHRREASMDAVARAHARIPTSPLRLLDAIPDLVGDGTAALTIRRAAAAPSGPPAGSYRLPARWSCGRTSGTGEVLVMPLWSWGSEVHLALARPTTITGRLLWSTRRLDRLSTRLTTALSEAAGRAPTRTRLDPPTRHTATSRWSFASASSSSPSRWARPV
jgi:hypothetical protein